MYQHISEVICNGTITFFSLMFFRLRQLCVVTVIKNTSNVSSTNIFSIRNYMDICMICHTHNLPFRYFYVQYSAVTQLCRQHLWTIICVNYLQILMYYLNYLKYFTNLNFVLRNLVFNNFFFIVCFYVFVLIYKRLLHGKKSCK